MIFLKICQQKRHWKASTELMVAFPNERQFLKLVEVIWSGHFQANKIF